jgi:ppGpp synthetase/RelA/SpoT-type nucleotidyltranferase
MNLEERRYSRNQVNRAGDILKLDNPDPAQRELAEDILTYWRTLHSYPINTFQSTLRNKLSRIDPDAIVAQRLKRIPSIVSKLRRIDGMQLSRMQDIVGLRAVVRDVERVRELESNYLKSRFDHRLVGQRDYIGSPKPTGYRGVHLIYRYANSKVPLYNGMYVELQIRTRLQHIWATAVEIMGTFLNYSLKSSEGPEEWLRFFSLTGSAFSSVEDCSPVPGYERFSDNEIFELVTTESERLGVVEKLRAFSVVANAISDDAKSGSYHLVVLDILEKTVSIKSFGRRRIEQANEEYTDVEREILDGRPLQAVLVYAGSIEALKRAYPNYFLDTDEFIKQLSLIKCG